MGKILQDREQQILCQRWASRRLPKPGLHRFGALARARGLPLWKAAALDLESTMHEESRAPGRGQSMKCFLKRKLTE